MAAACEVKGIEDGIIIFSFGTITLDECQYDWERLKF